jgi:phosphoribosylglycinamide formyltransferase-1
VNADVRVGVLASGRGSNFAALAAAAEDGSLGARVVRLVCDNPTAGAIDVAKRYGIAVTVVDAGARRGRVAPEAEARIVETLRADRVDLVCLAGFMRIVGTTLLDAFPRAVLNVHPSLLPSFPGLDAQRQALEHGVKVSGCTVHVVDAGIDSGPIVAQAAVPVHDDDSVQTLSARILAAEHRLYPQAVRILASGSVRFESRRTRIEPETARVESDTPRVERKTAGRDASPARAAARRDAQ